MIEVFGINSDPVSHYDDAGPSVEIARAAGFTAVRSPLWLRYGPERHRRFFDALRAAGLRPLAVLHRDAFTASEWENGVYEGRVAWWHEELGPGVDWEAGNEPEPGAGSASSTMTKQRFAAIIRQTRDAVGTDRVISGGLVSGDPYYVLDTDSGLQQTIIECCDGFGNHLYEETLLRLIGTPYAPYAPFVERVLDYWLPAAVEVAGKLGLTIDVTEIGFGERFYGHDLDRVGGAFNAIINELLPHVRSIYPFCQDRIMVPDYGMRDGDAVFPSWNICSGFAQALNTIPNPTGEAAPQTPPIEASEGANVNIEELAQMPQKDHPELPYGMWGLPVGIQGVETRTVYADTPEWQLIIGTPGPDGQEEAVVITPTGLYRPNP